MEAIAGRESPVVDKADRLLTRTVTAMAAAASAGLVAPAPDAQAAIVYSGVQNINVPSTISGIYLNLRTGAVGTSPVPGWDVNAWGTFGDFQLWGGNFAEPQDGLVSSLVPASNRVDNLPLGFVVDSSRTYSTFSTIEPTGTPFGIVLNSNDNYFGVRFFNEATSTVNFGWLHVHLGATADAQPRFIIEYAFNNTGGPINVGQIPEPSSLALLALGAAGLAAYRRRRSKGE